MKRFITRWALSSGIRTVNGEYTEDGKYFTGGNGYDRVFVSAKEAHEFLPDAVACARKMAAKKAASLCAMAAKLSAPSWQPKIIDKTETA
jgi:hypothetical protein